MNRLPIRALTWATVVAALLSAVMLAFDDTALPELARGGMSSIISR